MTQVNPEMVKQTFQLFPTDRCSRWGAAVMAVALVGSGQLAAAQSVLRFVGSEPSPIERVAALPQPHVAAVPEASPVESEFRFLDMSEGRVTPLPQLSISKQEVTADKQSTLKFTPSATKPAVATYGGGQPTADDVEMRFKVADDAATPKSPTVVKQATPSVANSVARPSAPVVETDSSFEQLATELFSHSPASDITPIKPRIVSAIEHVPAPAPVHVDAQPVRSLRETYPSVAVAPGTELFSSSSPTPFTASASPAWDVPALDYGAALRQVGPVQAPVAKAGSIAPTRAVARELPAEAANMFALGAPEPSKVEKPASASPPPIAATAPVNSFRDNRPELQAKTIAVAATSPPTVHRQTAAREQVKSPVAPPVATQQLVQATPQLPAASELDFSNATTTDLQSQQLFAGVVPRQLNTAVASKAPVVQEELVPASVVEQPRSNPAFAYQPGPLTNEPHVAEYKPALATPPAAKAPDYRQIIATVDPADSNTYTFSYAPTNGRLPAAYASGMQPVPAGGVGPEALTPDSLPAPCACGPGNYGQYGCPYLPGQSGTRALCGVDCGRYGAPCCSSWSDATCIPWALLGPGEYIGPARTAPVDTYYLRVNDVITLTFIESRKKSAEQYRIGVGDELQIEWLQGAANAESSLNRNLLVQPDGTVTLPLLGEVNAAGKTIPDFQDEVVKLYSKYQRDPQITVTPLTVNVAVQDVLKAVTAKNQSSGQTQDVKVTPEGTIQAAGIGSVYVQGLTLDELRNELEARYAQSFGPGLTVSPQLTERATSYVFIGGEVRSPGRYVLEGPTTVMQAIAMAGSWNNGGNLRQIVVFRRDENWCLKATKIDVRAPYYGKDPCPTNDIWLRENDLVIVPKSCILCATDLINLYFTRGIYAVFPISYVYDFSSNSGIVPVP